MAGAAWEAFDPTTPLLAVVPPAVMPGDTRRPANGSDVPFFHPDHQLFGFGGLVAATVAALYYVNEHGAGAGAHAKLGRASAGADLDLKGDK